MRTLPAVTRNPGLLPLTPLALLSFSPLRPLLPLATTFGSFPLVM